MHAKLRLVCYIVCPCNYEKKTTFIEKKKCRAKSSKIQFMWLQWLIYELNDFLISDWFSQKVYPLKQKCIAHKVVKIVYT